MNANVENVVMVVESVVESALIDTKSKRVAKPKLIVKYERYMNFGYWFANMLLTVGAIDQTVITAMLDKLRMYESLENQTALFESFEDELGDTQKTVRKLVADYHRPPKAPRASKKAAAVVSSDGVAVATKKGRKKKTTEVVVDNHDDFINQLVAVANCREPSPLSTKSVETVSVETVSVKTVVQTVEVGQINEIIETNSLNITGVVEKSKKQSAIKKVQELTSTIEPLVKKVVAEKKPRSKAVKAPVLATSVVAQSEELVAETVIVVATAATAELVVQVEEPFKPTKKPRAKSPAKKVAGDAATKSVVEKKPRSKSPAKKVAGDAVGVVATKAVVEKKPRSKPTEKKVKPVANVQPVATLVVLEPELVAEVLLQENDQENEQDDDDDDDHSHHTRKLDDSDNEDEKEEDEEESDIHAREFIFNDKHYLIDENTSDLYDIDTQDFIGKFDSATNSIVVV